MNKKEALQEEFFSQITQTDYPPMQARFVSFKLVKMGVETINNINFEDPFLKMETNIGKLETEKIFLDIPYMEIKHCID